MDEKTTAVDKILKKVLRARKAIPAGTVRKLWISSGGRCQYLGCNVALWKDELMHKDMNKAYISHIVAASENGPRGDDVKSPMLEINYDNLMLLCDECHNRIDESSLEEHPVEMLVQMKKQQEQRTEMLTGISDSNRSLVISYIAKVGTTYPSLKKEKAFRAILPAGYFPYNGLFIEGGAKNSPINDNEVEYWINEAIGLQRWFDHHVIPQMEETKCVHLSIFAIAPQPLLIKLGALISELRPASIFQYFRDPADSWDWQEDFSDLGIDLIRPKSVKCIPVLRLELSAPITNDRIFELFDDKEISLWTIRISEPRRDFLRSKFQLECLKNIFRKMYDEINLLHPNHSEIHVFPIMPNAAAIEFGRVRMPKADKQLIVYDYNNNTKSFIKALTIS